MDIGCGSNYRGTVNIDRYTDPNPHTTQIMKPREIPNFIIADAGRLPIRSHSIKVIHCAHTLEHLEDPLQALREIARIMTGVAVLRVPNNPVTDNHHAHLFSWSETSFRNLLSRVFEVKKIEITSPRGDLKTSPLMRVIMRLPRVFRRRMIQLLARVYGVELRAVCFKRCMI